MALSLVPGKHRLNLHAIYAETGGRRIDRDALLPEHFATWLDWARSAGLGLDFNPTYFAHPKASEGFTLAHVGSWDSPLLDRSRQGLSTHRGFFRQCPGDRPV